MFGAAAGLLSGGAGGGASLPSNTATSGDIRADFQPITTINNGSAANDTQANILGPGASLVDNLLNRPSSAPGINTSLWIGIGALLFLLILVIKSLR